MEFVFKHSKQREEADARMTSNAGATPSDTQGDPPFGANVSREEREEHKEV